MTPYMDGTLIWLQDELRLWSVPEEIMLPSGVRSRDPRDRLVWYVDRLRTIATEGLAMADALNVMLAEANGAVPRR